MANPSLPPGTYTLASPDGSRPMRLPTLILLFLSLTLSVRAQTPPPMVIPAGTYTITTTGPVTLTPAPVVVPSPPTPPPVVDPRIAQEAAARAEAAADIATEAAMVYTGDMAYVMDLVPLRSVTAWAIQSGNWSDPNTWMGRTVPGGTDLAWVMPGRTVTVDTTDAVARTLRVSGTLDTPPDSDSLLTVQTVVCDMAGTVQMGTVAAPIQANHSAGILYVSMAPRDPVSDPGQVGLGFISLGTLVVNGSPVTPFLAAASPAAAGATSVMLASAPSGWKAGDTVLVAGTTFANPSQDERVTIVTVNGPTITFAPALQYPHAAPDPQTLAVQYGQAPPGAPLAYHVANLTRNVSFASVAAAPISSRGHTMVMSAQTQISYASFTDLGRTDKSIPIDTVSNLRGRYALHFHRVGPTTALIPVVGTVVDGSPGWGTVNHSSNVAVSWSITTNCVGAGFVSEASDEQGSFTNNLALAMPGYPGGHPTNLRDAARVAVNDWGTEGHGLWMQSPYVVLTNNIAAGCQSVGIVHYPDDIGTPQNPAPGFATNATDSGSTVYASLYGLFYYESVATSPSQLVGLTTWACQYNAFGAAYSGGIAVNGQRSVGSAGNAVFLDSNPNVSYTSCYIVGFDTGLEPGHGGSLNQITNCYLRNNSADIIVYKTHNDNCASLGTRVVSLTTNNLGPKGIVVDGTIATLKDANRWTDRFAPESITWDGRQIYFSQQAPDQVFDSPLASMNGLTNQQILTNFGVAYAGAVIPPNAGPIAGVTGGVVGPASPPPPGPLIPNAANVHRDGSGLTDLMWQDPDNGMAYVQQTVRTTDVKPGWMASFVVDTQKRPRVGFRQNP